MTWKCNECKTINSDLLSHCMECDSMESDDTFQGVDDFGNMPVDGIWHNLEVQE